MLVSRSSQTQLPQATTNHLNESPPPSGLLEPSRARGVGGIRQRRDTSFSLLFTIPTTSPRNQQELIWYITGLIGAAIAVFVVWRYTSIARGARKRDEQLLLLLDPIGEKLATGNAPSRTEIDDLAALHQIRGFLYELLKYYERLDLFPEKFRNEIAQAETRLAYWLMHPNELQAAPEKIELVTTVTRKIENEDCRFYVFKYTMPNDHWAGKDWLLGLAGPYIDGQPPYTGIAGAFSRCGDKFGDVVPEELVDWYVAMATRKRG